MDILCTLTVSYGQPRPGLDELDEDVSVQTGLDRLVQHVQAPVLAVDVLVAQLDKLASSKKKFFDYARRLKDVEHDRHFKTQLDPSSSYPASNPTRSTTNVEDSRRLLHAEVEELSRDVVLPNRSGHRLVVVVLEVNR